jgi:DNA-binding NarL/FixJ family response regulator
MAVSLVTAARRIAAYMPDPVTDPLRVVVVDDHSFFRAGLTRMLRSSGVEVVAEAASGEDAIRVVAETAPDVVLMDLSMPGMSGIEATRRLLAESAATKVLVLTVSAEEADVTDAILAGASGYVLKDGPLEEVLAGIEAVAAGQSIISPRIATFMLQHLRESAPEVRDIVGVRLSNRELEVLGLLAEGRANHEIAELLVISQSTVRNHISSILLKLQVQNRVQAAVRAVREHLV